MYETMSNDNMVSTSIRKSNQPNFKSNNKEDHHQSCAAENGRIAAATTTSTTTTNLVADGLLSPPTTTTTTQNQNQQIAFNPNNSSNQSAAAAASSSSAVANHEMFLQWGPRKRSRCARTEARSIASAVLEKQHQTTTSIAAAAATANHVMPPPHPNPNLPSTSNGNRSGTSTRVRPHNLLYSKDTPAFQPSKNRNIVDQMGTNSGSPSRNGGGGGGGGGSSRPISRSAVGKRSPSCIDKNDNHHNNNNSKKICSTSGGIRKVKSDDSLTPNTNTATNGNGGNHVDAHGEHEHGGGGGGGGGHGVSMVCSPVTDAEKGGELIEWPRIFISLSRKEKEDDFYAMKGTKLPHRPKKRAKAVDRALQYCFPGLWLSDLTRARYEVRERKSAKKQPKRRGLKGLETMESDSE